MSVTRRGIFGFLAAAPVMAAAVKPGAVRAEPGQPKSEFLVGQVRAVHSHYETRWAPSPSGWDGGHTHAFTIGNCAGGHSCSVAVVHYEQWDGAVWRPISSGQNLADANPKKDRP